MNPRMMPQMMVCTVDDVGEEYARVTDSFGKRQDVRILPRRGGGPRPQVGETWIIDQPYGQWTFAALLIPNPPEVTGEDVGNTGVRNLLTTLDDLGLILNNVTQGGGTGPEGGVLIPAGTIFPFGSESIPAGFLACDGSEVSRTTYDELYAVIGDTYGAGDGSTTFNLPDLIRRWPLGAGTTTDPDRSGTSSVGTGGGAINHTHAQTAHTHSVNPPPTSTTLNGTHGHSIPSGSGLGSGTARAAGTSDSGSHSHSVNIGNFQSGNGSANGSTDPTGSANPSYLVVQYMISTVALQGEQGPTGPAGADGAEWFTGAGTPDGGLGEIGDFYLDTNNGNVFEKTGASTWTLRDNLTGPQGPQGVQGDPGEKWYTGSGAPDGGTGIVGDLYLNTDNGDVYEKTGASTWTLIANIEGPQGPAGSDGADGSVWYNGSGAPSGALGVVGDYYLDNDTGDVYEKTGASTWTLVANIEGPPPTSLGDIGDVNLTGLADGDGIIYDQTSGDWIPGAAAGGDAGLSDVLMLGGM